MNATLYFMNNTTQIVNFIKIRTLFYSKNLILFTILL